MAFSQRQRVQLRALCDELREDDGIDPRQFFKPARKRDKEHRKSKQLCRQVQKTLEQVLSGETGDDLLNSLKIIAIVPGTDSSRLLVSVVADLPPDRFDRRQIEARLEAVMRRLRTEVTAAITRKKTPVLTFQVLGPEAGQAGTTGEEEQP